MDGVQLSQDYRATTRRQLPLTTTIIGMLNVNVQFLEVNFA